VAFAENAVGFCSGGLWNAVLSTLEIGGSAFGLFLRSQRTWHCKPLDDNDAELFKKTLKVGACCQLGIAEKLADLSHCYLMIVNNAF